MSDPTFTVPPDAPSRQAPSTFSARMDAFLAWMAAFQPQLAALVTWMSSQVASIATSVAAASTSATNAATSASAAAGASGTAGEAAGVAVEAAEEAGTALTSIRAYYLGESAADPVVDLNGDPVSDGQWYVNTTTGTLRIRVGGNFVAGVMDAGGALVAANNLSDMPGPAEAVRNIGLSFSMLSATATAAPFQSIAADVSVGAWTLSLPAAPEAGDWVRVVVVTGDPEADALTVSGNSNNINGDANLTVDVIRATVTLISSGTEWRIS